MLMARGTGTHPDHRLPGRDDALAREGGGERGRLHAQQVAARLQCLALGQLRGCGGEVEDRGR